MVTLKYDRFLLGVCLFSGAFAVSFRECITFFKFRFFSQVFTDDNFFLGGGAESMPFEQ